MAGTSAADMQKQFLAQVRNLTTEKSQGERRIVGLTKQVNEVQSELKTAYSELEDAKRAKESIEQELKGCEVELALSETSIQSLKSRISLLNGKLSTVRSEVDALKNEEGALRVEHINHLLALNTKIRKFGESLRGDFHESFDCDFAEGEKPVVKEVDEEDSNTLEDMIARVLAETASMQEEYQMEQNIQKQSQRELIDSERKVSLIEVITKSSRALQDLNNQTSELEQICSSIGESLQRRCICPNCHLDNVEVIGDLLQPN